MNRSLASKIQTANTVLIENWDFGQIGEFFTSDYVAHLTRRDMKGHTGIKRYLRSLQRAFPTLYVTAEILIESKDHVAWQRTLKGAHEGEYAGFSPSRRKIIWRDMAITHVRDGLIAEEWVISDLAEQLLRTRNR